MIGEVKIENIKEEDFGKAILRWRMIKGQEKEVVEGIESWN